MHFQNPFRPPVGLEVDALVPSSGGKAAVEPFDVESCSGVVGERGNNGNVRRSFAFALAYGPCGIPLKHVLSDHHRTGPNAAPSRQAGAEATGRAGGVVQRARGRRRTRGVRWVSCSARLRADLTRSGFRAPSARVKSQRVV
jgi:hypothetical protein